jgi:hypothetical protein
VTIHKSQVGVAALLGASVSPSPRNWHAWTAVGRRLQHSRGLLLPMTIHQRLALLSSGHDTGRCQGLTPGLLHSWHGARHLPLMASFFVQFVHSASSDGPNSKTNIGICRSILR